MIVTSGNYLSKVTSITRHEVEQNGEDVLEKMSERNIAQINRTVAPPPPRCVLYAYY